MVGIARWECRFLLPSSHVRPTSGASTFGACGYTPKYNKLFSIQSIERGIKFARNAGGLSSDHLTYVLEQAELPTTGSVKQLRARLKRNLGQCLRPFVPWYMYPHTQRDYDRLADRESRYDELTAEFRAHWGRIDAAEELRKIRERVEAWQATAGA